jgi:hypothetical protein
MPSLVPSTTSRIWGEIEPPGSRRRGTAEGAEVEEDSRIGSSTARLSRASQK